jgi:type I restriction enzyme M protein
MKSSEHSESLEQMVRKFAKTMENKCDVTRYQELLFRMLALKCASESVYGDHALNVPGESQWNHLKGKSESSTFDAVIATALEAFEKSNTSFNGFWSQENWKAATGILKPAFEFIDSLPVDSFKSIDLFGRIYEYLNTGTAGRKNGIFLTPDCVAQLLAVMLLPYGGIIYDPCCGTGTMFVHAINFIRKNRNCTRGVYFYGQESNLVLSRLCRLNLTLRGFDNSRIHWNREGSLLEDAFPDVKADFILTNPPFNQKNWGGKKLKNDPRWIFGKPPDGNGNFAWIQHVAFHLVPGGRAGILLPNGSLSSSYFAESRIRQKLVDLGIVEYIIGLPDRLFLNTSISACIWGLSRQ